MEVNKTIVGYLSENCYLLKIGNEGLIIDPGDEVDKIIDMIGDTKILGILITHAHFDHIGALDELVKKIITVIASLTFPKACSLPHYIPSYWMILMYSPLPIWHIF